MTATPPPRSWTPGHHQQAATLAHSRQSPYHSPSPNHHPVVMSTTETGWFSPSSLGPQQPQTRQATPTPPAAGSPHDARTFGVDPRLIQGGDGEGATLYPGDYFAPSHEQLDYPEQHDINSFTSYPREEQQNQHQHQYPDSLSFEQFQSPDVHFAAFNGDTIPSTSESFYPDYSFTHPGFGTPENVHALPFQYPPLGTFGGRSDPRTASPTPFSSPALTAASLSGHNSEVAPFSREGSSVPPFGGSPSDNDFEVAGGPDNYNVPYNQQLFDCLMAAPQHQLALKDIYEWFVVCRGKNADDKSWQNSIRHNLSMNDAFQKVTTPQHSHPNSPTASPANNHQATAKNLWRLSPAAATRGFVEPTTRFRHHPHKKTTHLYHATTATRKPVGGNKPNYPRPRYPTRGTFVKSSVDANGAGYYPNGVVSLSANDGCTDEDGAFRGRGDFVTSPAPQRQASGSRGGCAARRSNRLKARMRMGLLNESGYGYGFGGGMGNVASGTPTSHPGSRQQSPLPGTSTPTPRSTPFPATLTRAGTPVQSRFSTPGSPAAQAGDFASRATSFSAFSTPEPDGFSLNAAGFGSEPQPHAQWQEGGGCQSLPHQHQHDVHGRALSFENYPLQPYGFVEAQEQRQEHHHEQTPLPADETSNVSGNPNDNPNDNLDPFQDLCDFVYGGTADADNGANPLTSCNEGTDVTQTTNAQTGDLDPMLSLLDDPNNDLDLSHADPAGETLLKWSQSTNNNTDVADTKPTGASGHSIDPTLASNSNDNAAEAHTLLDAFSPPQQHEQHQRHHAETDAEELTPNTPPPPYSVFASNSSPCEPTSAAVSPTAPQVPPNTPTVFPASTATIAASAGSVTRRGSPGLSVATLPTVDEAALMELDGTDVMETCEGGNTPAGAEMEGQSEATAHRHPPGTSMQDPDAVIEVKSEDQDEEALASAG
ncbi:MAG: hypothetical protein M1831_006204 [Alyxoria varia]|nr:MAG: hypothetical protein M1831_006204 [Alyxoria varia]